MGVFGTDRRLPLAAEGPLWPLRASGGGTGRESTEPLLGHHSRFASAARERRHVADPPSPCLAQSRAPGSCSSPSLPEKQTTSTPTTSRHVAVIVAAPVAGRARVTGENPPAAASRAPASLYRRAGAAIINGGRLLAHGLGRGVPRYPHGCPMLGGIKGELLPPPSGPTALVTTPRGATWARQQKCAQYWPAPGHRFTTGGGVEVACVSESKEQALVVRHFRIAVGDEVRVVTQIHVRESRAGGPRAGRPPPLSPALSPRQYTGWPDHGVPDDFGPIMRLFELVDKAESGHNDKPVVVHCRYAAAQWTIPLTPCSRARLLAPAPTPVRASGAQARLSRSICCGSRPQPCWRAGLAFPLASTSSPSSPPSASSEMA